MSEKEELKPIYYVDFTVEKENWGIYKIEDGGLLKIKLVLISIISEKPFTDVLKKVKESGEKGIDMALQSTNVMAVQVPFNLRGKPSNVPCTSREMRESIIEDDLDFETIAESYNVYQLNFPDVAEHLYLKIKSSPVKVSRTNKFDQYGIPLYFTRSKTDAKFSIKA